MQLNCWAESIQTSEDMAIDYRNQNAKVKCARQPFDAHSIAVRLQL